MADVITGAQTQMERSVEATKSNFAGIRTGRANPALLNGILVNYYGSPTPLRSLASIGVPEPRTLAITPYDVSQAAAVEKAIRDSDLGVNPNRDGAVIRVTLPELTEDRRREYVKLAGEKAEDGKVAVRNIRRRVREGIEDSVKEGDIGEDEGERLQKRLDAVTKKVSDQIDGLLQAKQREILEV